MCHDFWKSVFTSSCAQERSSSIHLDPEKHLNLKKIAFVAYIWWVVLKHGHHTCAVVAFWALVISPACFCKINVVFVFYFCSFGIFFHFKVYPSELKLIILVLQLIVSVQLLWTAHIIFIAYKIQITILARLAHVKHTWLLLGLWSEWIPQN